ncbi:MAG: HDOD domain-containing protein [Geobacteraceae bacterium]|nr:HDOD domain-containing protein [Geobacteraceae bacterium]
MPVQTSVAEIRQRILLLKEVPPLPVIAQKILCMSVDSDVVELSDMIEKAPCIAARILGVANSAYFGWPGGVRSIYDAIYKVLGIKLVKSLAIGIAISEVFDVRKCRGFRPEQYWFTAIVTAQLSQGFLRSVFSFLRGDLDNVHVNGLLHNFGLPVLAHLFPNELSKAFLPLPPDEQQKTTTERILAILGIDQNHAGGWLARKWHLPRDIVCVMENHKDTAYRGDFWPVVLLVGYCERQAKRFYLQKNMVPEPEVETVLGINEATVEKMGYRIECQIDDIHSMAALMATGG